MPYRIPLLPPRQRNFLLVVIVIANTLVVVSGKKEAYPETQRDRKQQCIKCKIRSDVGNGGAEVKYFECIYGVETDWDGFVSVLNVHGHHTTIIIMIIWNWNG